MTDIPKNVTSNALRPWRAHAITLLLLAAALALTACLGEGEDESAMTDGGFVEVIKEVPVEKVVVQEVPVEVVVERQVAVEKVVTAAPAQAQSVQLESEQAAGPMQDLGDTQQQTNQFAIQKRIIIYTVDMTLEIVDVATSVDEVGAMAREMGGWIVSTSRAERHVGFISIRVPAERLDEAVARLRGMAVDVQAENASSRDVTDEYVDLTSRLGNLEATETALLRLFDRAATVEEALDVQRTLSNVQGEIEVIKGRINFLEQTSAFSLINVTLVLEPQDMEIDAGGDQVAGVGQPVQFRAFFKPPEGIDYFSFVWDFGDGSGPYYSDRTAPTADEDTRVTAPVSHVYYDVQNSPYFAEITITGTGDSGAAEAKASVVVTVSEIPVITVFAGDSITVEEGQEAEFSGSFTSPEGVSDLKFRWTFGDGTSPETGDVEPGVTTATAAHVYANYRPDPYTATLTITGKTDAGDIRASDTIEVFVNEEEGLVIGGWSAGDTGRSAVRALSAVGAALAQALIWVGIFSPVWIVILVVAFFVRRRVRRRKR
ncbi:MAG: DUF4349 domain-containing protein [Chloroflexi bacterium]|nr:DUF4349 domain-containing protein [Chloroflexota bacterium]